jgi:lipid II:glycine glycyltransferase (peptidoglycan interpeptide bridge formation enzyme)
LHTHYYIYKICIIYFFQFLYIWAVGIYIVFCGNTCHSVLDIEDEFLQSVELYENKERKHKIPPRFKSYFKPIYDKYKKNPELFISKLNNLEENIK